MSRLLSWRISVRSGAVAKLGWYPCAPEAIDAAMKYVRVTDQPGEIHGLDPCAGTGEAFNQIAQLLGKDEHKCCAKFYCVELDEERSAELHERYDCWGWNILAPASAYGCNLGTGYSLAYVNPPFDHSMHRNDYYGGTAEREELNFLRMATHCLATDGVLLYVVPGHVASRESVRDLLHAYYDRLAMLPFPPQVRNYDEVFIFGVRRKFAKVGPDAPKLNGLTALPHPAKVMIQQGPYIVPATRGPSQFIKTEPTEGELWELVNASPLSKLMHESPSPTSTPRPPLALSKGHIALTLAAGQLNGIVSKPGERPHVIRGTASKKEEQTERDLTPHDDGTTTCRTVYTEKIRLVVRVLKHTGEIVTLSDSSESDEQEEEEEEE